MKKPLSGQGESIPLRQCNGMFEILAYCIAQGRDRAIGNGLVFQIFLQLSKKAANSISSSTSLLRQAVVGSLSVSG